MPEHDYHVAQQTCEQQLAAARQEIEHLNRQLLCTQSAQSGIACFGNDVNKLRFYTGFHSFELFSNFYHAMRPTASNITTWTQMQRINAGASQPLQDNFRQTNLLIIDQLLLFLQKVRLGTFDQELADKFKVSVSTVSRTVITWANFLYFLLGSSPLWPSRSAVDNNMPESFKQMYPKTRVILDCTEIHTQTPSSLNLNSEFYSHYKGRNTMKSLVGITPAGAICFVSSLYPGSISDKQITKQSGVLQLLEPGDAVMADKGFLIENELRELGVELIIPPFLTKQRSQLSKEEVYDTQKIARLRIHVERAIRRIKEFHIFDQPIQLAFSGTVNQIWAVCCLLTNFQGPLY